MTKDQQQLNARVKSLSEFSHWVVKIILRSSKQHQIKLLEDNNILFSMTRDNITLHSWAKHRANAARSHGEVKYYY